MPTFDDYVRLPADGSNPGKRLLHHKITDTGTDYYIRKFIAADSTTGDPIELATQTTLAALNLKIATAKTADFDTGGGTDTVAMMGIALPASGGAVAGGTSTNPVRTDPTGTTAQPITDNGGNISIDDGGNSITVDGAVTISAAIPAGTNNIGDVDIISSALPTGAATEATLASLNAKFPAPVFPKVIQVSTAAGITTATVWDEWARWQVPTNKIFKPKIARASVTTAGTRTLILAGKKLATFNPNSGAFTSLTSVSGDDFYDRLFYRIETTHSATATNVTATYNDQAGASSTSAALTIPSAAPAGNWYEFVLATGDFGVQSVTNVTDSANPTSVVDEIWGVRTLFESQGAANALDVNQLGGESLMIDDTESIIILFNAAATTGQQRFANILGDLVAE
jgi:hypothetical protein